MQRHLIIYSLGGASIATTLASVVLNSIYATVLDRTLADIRILTFVTAALNALACIALLILLLFYVAKVKEACSSSLWKNWGFGIVGVFLLSTAILVGITLARSNARYITAPPTALKQRQSRPLFLAWCGVWGGSVVIQGLFYGFLLVSSTLFASVRREPPPPNNSCRQISYDLRTLPRSQEQRTNHHQDSTTNRSFNSQRPAFSFRRESLTASERVPNSVRSSFSGDMRLVLSRSRMRSQNHSQTQSFQTRRDSRASSCLDRYASLSEDAQEPEQHAFDQWDTSAVSPEIRDSVWQSNRDSNCSMGTIGRIQEQTSIATAAGTTLSSTRSNTITTNINSGPTSPPSRGRTRSSSVESHIHPLFRSDSPNPPPIVTTPRTSTSVSRPPTAVTSSNPTPRPSPLKIHSEGVDDGPGPAVDSQGEGVEASADADADRGDDTNKRSSKTLPIPGFILSAGARSSLVGYEKRRDVS